MLLFPSAHGTFSTVTPHFLQETRRMLCSRKQVNPQNGTNWKSLVLILS